MRFEEIYGRFRVGRLSCEAAAELLGASVSSFYRWRESYEEQGAAGLADARLGKPSARRAAVDEVARVLDLFETRYFDFTVKHFHEKLPEHGIGSCPMRWCRSGAPRRVLPPCQAATMGSLMV